ncbi:hypothetical protein [Gellertiella hungarica]|uniref:Uncharacterized protein n=1 Tax=Gellertiella hungarica TaxID=1572859 RepID=A0A7W6J6N8_9HYPH|nr:hypothetical protein [Gellertiella hungarica]MBB4065790.1 hypothetical protein [Gellertiella hungarica]
MSNQPELFFEQQDFQTQLALTEFSGEELTEIAVEALYRAFELMREDVAPETVH